MLGRIPFGSSFLLAGWWKATGSHVALRGLCSPASAAVSSNRTGALASLGSLLSHVRLSLGISHTSPGDMSGKPDHHLPNPGWFGPRFTNPWTETPWEDKKLSDVIKWFRERKKKEVSLDGHLIGIPHPTKEDFARAFPLVPVDWDALANPPADAIQAVWAGHATVLVQQGGLAYITDPVFSERCSAVQWAGPKRLVPPAFHLDAPRLPHLDFVLLSHNHYDHLDSGSVAALNKRFGTGLTWYIPLGVKSWFDSAGIKGPHVVELDWWQQVQHVSPSGATATITMTPAQHWSGRGLHDRRHTLWGGFSVHTGGEGTSQPPLSFWFAGDTGYCDIFKEIGQRLGPFDLAAIPTGAYDPRWFMAPQHTDAEEGLQVHRDVRSRRSIAIHCATFCLTEEPLDEPQRRLAEALAATKGDPAEFVTLRHGERIVVKEGRTLNTPLCLGPTPEQAAAAVKARELPKATDTVAADISA
mmetsp:Transcript_37707/g.95348  ORF Transcript_37707/g.95348 Transcript_37707/m.95348 type:complete len:471 (-) Transcript_37707:601-2013(-)